MVLSGVCGRHGVECILAGCPENAEQAGLLKNPSEEAIDAEVKYLLDFGKSMLKKYRME